MALLLGEKFLSEARGGVPGRGGCQIRPDGTLTDDGKRSLELWTFRWKLLLGEKVFFTKKGGGLEEGGLKILPDRRLADFA